MIRKAKIKDVKQIHSLLNHYAQRGELLPRSLNDLYECLRDFYVFEAEDHEIIGVCSLHINWEDLAEIRSLAVKEEQGRQGVGTELVRECLEEARQMGVAQVFALTYKPAFFERMGFRQIDKGLLPQKIWGDCVKCFKFPECDEIALLLPLAP